MRKGRDKDTRGQSPSHTASHGVRSKVYRREKDKSPETKDRWNNLSLEKLARNKPR